MTDRSSNFFKGETEVSNSHTAFFIAQDRRQANGRMLLGERLSRPLRRTSIAKRVLKRIRRHTPAAYALQVTTL